MIPILDACCGNCKHRKKDSRKCYDCVEYSNWEMKEVTR